jgi:2-polyprenyl-3-methyl-5-hydroxy-6-metoxy-1,4-benzoquinol methylase
LVFVPPEFYLSADAEKAEYDQHENNIADEGYQQFLNRLWSPLKEVLRQNQTVLDFGCGPGPLLAKMMQQDGMKVSVYDHFYHPDQTVLQPNYYDAITSTEVIEHLHQPKDVFEKWLSMLKPNGHLGLMTKRVKDKAAFATWHYKNDLTHVCFFSEACFEWLAHRYQLTYRFVVNDVVIFQKS